MFITNASIQTYTHHVNAEETINRTLWIDGPRARVTCYCASRDNERSAEYAATTSSRAHKVRGGDWRAGGAHGDFAVITRVRRRCEWGTDGRRKQTEYVFWRIDRHSCTDGRAAKKTGTDHAPRDQTVYCRCCLPPPPPFSGKSTRDARAPPAGRYELVVPIFTVLNCWRSWRPRRPFDKYIPIGARIAITYCQKYEIIEKSDFY